MSKILSHVEEYAARYAVLVIAVLTPAAALLGELAADLGGSDTPAGRAILGATAALAVVVAGATFLRNLGKYQIVRDFGELADLFDGLKSGGGTVLNAGTVNEVRVEGEDPVVPEESGTRPVPPTTEG